MRRWCRVHRRDGRPRGRPQDIRGRQGGGCEIGDRWEIAAPASSPAARVGDLHPAALRGDAMHLPDPHLVNSRRLRRLLCVGRALWPCDVPSLQRRRCKCRVQSSSYIPGRTVRTLYADCAAPYPPPHLPPPLPSRASQMLGRMLVCRLPRSAPYVVLLCLARCGFGPILSAFGGPAHARPGDTPLANAAPALTIFLFALSNGWLCTVVFVRAPAAVEPLDRPAAGSLLVLFLNAGLIVGSLLSFAMRQ